MVNKKRGFTLIEILIVIGVIIILATGIIISLNPGRQFAKARNAQRATHIQDIVKAIYQNISDNNGNFNCGAGDIPNTLMTMATGTGNYDIASCLVPTYMPTLPVDPRTGVWRGVSDYNTGYQIQRDQTTGRIIIRAPSAELGETIQVVQ